jgi:hypothetical protein
MISMPDGEDGGLRSVTRLTLNTQFAFGQLLDSQDNGKSAKLSHPTPLCPFDSSERSMQRSDKQGINWATSPKTCWIRSVSCFNDIGVVVSILSSTQPRSSS